MAIDLLPDRQYGAPTDADGAALTLPGSAWSNTAFGEVLASADADLILTGLILRPIGTLFEGENLEADVAIGAAASEVVIATFKGILHEVFAAIGGEGCYLPTVIGLAAIPSGSRVSVRWRVSNTATTTASLSISYLKAPLAGTLLTTANPLLVTPAGASCPTVTTGGSWADGAAVELLDASGPSRALVHIVTHVAEASTEWEVDICLGDDADVVAWTEHCTRGGVSSFPNVISLPNPLVLPAATKVSAKTRAQDIAVLSVQVGLTFVELPL